MNIQLFSSLVVLLSLNGVARAYPGAGAIAGGRATCGTEYDTPYDAFVFPDVRETWRVARIATCESPVFWTKFETRSDKRGVYIAVTTPEIDRFEDELQFHAILYGPNLKSGDVQSTGFRSVPSDLPSGIKFDKELAKDGAVYLTQSKGFGNCEESVDQSSTLMDYAKKINGRCTEVFDLPKDYVFPIEQNLDDIHNWIIYQNMNTLPKTGIYHMQAWVTTRNNVKKTAQGKYEISIGSRSWEGEPSESTLALAHTQKTKCTCGLNGIEFREQHLERLGKLSTNFMKGELPGGSCGSSKAPKSTCTSGIEVSPKLSEDSKIKWSALYKTKPNRKYEMTFHPIYQGEGKGEAAYPNDGMYIYLKNWLDFVSFAARGDRIFNEQIQGEKIVVTDKTDSWLRYGQVQYIKFSDPKNAAKTKIKINPVATDAPLIVFTDQHPGKYYAQALRDVDSGEYIFSTISHNYEKQKESKPKPITKKCAKEGERALACGDAREGNERPDTCCEGFVCELGSGNRCVESALFRGFQQPIGRGTPEAAVSMEKAKSSASAIGSFTAVLVSTTLVVGAMVFAAV